MFLKVALLTIAAVVGAWLVISWLIMLTAGIAHLEWWPAIPLMSWHAASAIGLPVMLILGFAGGANKASKNRF